MKQPAPNEQILVNGCYLDNKCKSVDSDALQPDNRGVSTLKYSANTKGDCVTVIQTAAQNKLDGSTLSVIRLQPQCDVIEFVSSVPEKHPGKFKHMNIGVKWHVAQAPGHPPCAFFKYCT